MLLLKTQNYSIKWNEIDITIQSQIHRKNNFGTSKCTEAFKGLGNSWLSFLKYIKDEHYSESETGKANTS